MANIQKPGHIQEHDPIDVPQGVELYIGDQCIKKFSITPHTIVVVGTIRDNTGAFCIKISSIESSSVIRLELQIEKKGKEVYSVINAENSTKPLYDIIIHGEVYASCIANNSLEKIIEYEPLSPMWLRGIIKLWRAKQSIFYWLTIPLLLIAGILEYNNNSRSKYAIISAQQQIVSKGNADEVMYKYQKGLIGTFVKTTQEIGEAYSADKKAEIDKKSTQLAELVHADKQKVPRLQAIIDAKIEQLESIKTQRNFCKQRHMNQCFIEKDEALNAGRAEIADQRVEINTLKSELALWKQKKGSTKYGIIQDGINKLNEPIQKIYPPCDCYFLSIEELGGKTETIFIDPETFGFYGVVSVEDFSSLAIKATGIIAINQTQYSAFIQEKKPLREKVRGFVWGDLGQKSQTLIFLKPENVTFDPEILGQQADIFLTHSPIDRILARLGW